MSHSPKLGLWELFYVRYFMDKLRSFAKRYLSYVLVAVLASAATWFAADLLPTSKLDRLTAAIENRFIGDADTDAMQDAAAEAMIASFSMLSEEDKFDVITNIDNYSLNDIEAKLAVICVRKKVSFGVENESTNQEPITTYNLNNTSVEEDTVPDWVKAVRATVKNMN